MDVKEDSFRQEELVTALKGLKDNKIQGAGNVVNEFLKYGSSEVRNKQLTIMNTIFEKDEVSTDF